MNPCVCCLFTSRVAVVYADSTHGVRTPGPTILRSADLSTHLFPAVQFGFFVPPNVRTLVLPQFHCHAAPLLDVDSNQTYIGRMRRDSVRSSFFLLFRWKCLVCGFFCIRRTNQCPLSRFFETSKRTFRRTLALSDTCKVPCICVVARRLPR